METKDQSDREFAQVVEGQYPHSLASTFRRARTIDEDDVLNRHDLIEDLFEIVTKYLAIIALQNVRECGQLSEYLQDFMRNMLHPALGQWNEIIRTTCSGDLSKSKITQSVAGMYRAKIPVEVRPHCERVQTFLSSKLSLKVMKDVFDLLVLYRNKVKGHGAKISKAEYRERLVVLESCVHQILRGSAFLKDYDLMHVDEIVVLPTGEFKHKTKNCMGTQVEPGTLVRSSPLLPNHLYLRDVAGEADHFLDLHPLLIFTQCRECKQEQTFVFNDFRKDRLEYLSYSCGHFLYPDMLPTEFERFFQISLSVIPGEERKSPVTDEEADEKATDELTRGIAKISSREYYEALDHLQLSLSYKSTWDTNYYLALLLMLTKASPAEIFFYLNSCQQLNPDEPGVARLVSTMTETFGTEVRSQKPTKEQGEKLAAIAAELLEERSYSPDVKSIYHYLTPKVFRRFGYLFWMCTPALLLAGRTFLTDLLGYQTQMPVLLLKIGMIWSFVTTIFLISRSMKDVYFSLAEQLVPKYRESFPEWYQAQIQKMFGTLDNDLKFFHPVHLRSPENAANLRLFLVLFPLAVSGSIYLTCYGSNDLPRYLFEFLDYMIVWVVIIPAISIVLKTFLFFSEYAKLPLKPVISSVNRYSLERIGGMMLTVSVPYALCYTMLTIIGYLSFSVRLVVSQLVLFYFMTGMGCVWTLVTPLYFSRALARAKEKVVARYRVHLEDSFKTLLEDPNPQHLERYHWLKLQQKEVLDISTRTLSTPVLIGVIAINTYILMIAVLYPFAKFHISSTDIVHWLQGTFR